MIIYKFKDLRDENKHSHFYQIVLRNTIWCAKPDSLNDDEEFKFKLDYNPSTATANFLSQVVAKYKKINRLPPDLSAALVLQQNKLEEITIPIINKVISDCRNSMGIISFSSIKDDNHLWNEYGGNGNGVCIEINIPDSALNKAFYRVNYVAERIIHIDSFLESALFSDGTFNIYRDILLTKTRGKWSQEKEIRFIGNRQEVNLIIDGYISEVTFGAHVPTHTFEQINANIINHCNANNIKITKL